MLNASTLSGPKKRASSTNDTRVSHPYVVNERINMLLVGDKTPWTTSKITRKKDGTVSITVYTKN